MLVAESCELFSLRKKNGFVYEQTRTQAHTKSMYFYVHHQRDVFSVFFLLKQNSSKFVSLQNNNKVICDCGIGLKMLREFFLY